MCHLADMIKYVVGKIRQKSLTDKKVSTIFKPMQDFKVNILIDDIFKKPQGKLLLIPVFEDEIDKDNLFKKVDQLLNKTLSKKAKDIRFKGEDGDILTISSDSTKTGFEEIVFFGLGKKGKFDRPKFEKILADRLRKIASDKIDSVAFLVDQRYGRDFFKLGKLFGEALYLSQYRFDKYKSKEERKKIVKVSRLNIYLNKSKIPASKIQNLVEELEKGVEFGKIVSQGVYLARDLVNEPASFVHPQTLVRQAFEIEKKSKGKIEVEVLDEDECGKEGMGAFLAVGQGSERKPKFIVLHYKGSKGKKVCLVGKSITFDSGGLSLKTSKAMELMKIDMAGGAAVLGVFNVLAQAQKAGLDLKIDQEIYGILPTCENMPSGRAIRPGDIVKAANGKTIEILNTDAEGRLTLADALSYAEKKIKPDFIIDIATLTGEIMIALGDEMAGLFGNNQELVEEIKKAASQENEELWQMPLHKDYLEKMKSELADLRNIGKTSFGGSISAALFLEEFIDKSKWAHLDIAGVAFNDERPKGLLPKGATGWGVRTLVNWLSNQ